MSISHILYRYILYICINLFIYGNNTHMPARLSLDENDFKGILNGMVDGVITINQQGLILTFNKQPKRCSVINAMKLLVKMSVY